MVITTTIDRFLKNTFGILSGPVTDELNSVSRNRMAEYAMLKSYQKVYERNKIKRPINTNKQINYTETLPFGSTVKVAKKQMTNPPVQALFNTDNINRNIFLFTETQGNVEVQLEMHFHKDSLFLIKVLFPKASPTLRTNLIKGLLNEYQLENVDLTLHTIYDNSNNCIQIRDLNTFEIIYTSLQNPFFDKLVKEINTTNNQLLADYKLTSAPIINK